MISGVLASSSKCITISTFLCYGFRIAIRDYQRLLSPLTGPIWGSWFHIRKRNESLFPQDIEVSSWSGNIFSKDEVRISVAFLSDFEKSVQWGIFLAQSCGVFWGGGGQGTFLILSRRMNVTLMIAPSHELPLVSWFRGHLPEIMKYGRRETAWKILS